jgi:GMP synthase-like glutamine amidotransferase
MILLVDYEHASSRETEWGREIMRLRTELTYKLEDLAHDYCMLVRYDRVSDDLLRMTDPTAIFISGNGTDPARYTDVELAPIEGVIRAQEYPIMGFCGGFQLMASALGVELQPMGAVRDDVTEADAAGSPFASASVTEVGWLPVDLDGAHEILAGLGDAPVMRHAHMFEIAETPAGFARIARTDLCEEQMFVNDASKAVGTQFHPESWTDEHPAGGRLISNFLDWVRD